MSNIFEYQPDSKVLLDFHNSNAVIKAISGPPGCIALDTMVHYKREGGRSNTIRLKDLIDYVNNGRNKYFASSIDLGTNVSFYNEIISAQLTGFKELFRVDLEFVGKVDITGDDSLLGIDYEFVKVSDLEIGDTVIVRCGLGVDKVKILGIDSIGVHQTGDLTMKAPHHNFVVNNGIIKHNSGKSVAIVTEICTYMAMRQEADKNGNRHIAYGIIRSTYDRLKKTTRKTFEKWIPKELGTITKSSPIGGTIKYPHPSGDGTNCIIDLIFIAIESEADFDKLDSFEVSGWFINEMSENKKKLLGKAVERIGRVPSVKDGVLCSEPTVLIDFNPQGQEHWLYDVIVRGNFKPPEIEGVDLSTLRPLLEYFEQPPAVFCENFEAADAGREEPRFSINPNADNINNVGQDYYINQLRTRMAAREWDQICTRLMMMWRTTVRGKLVHPSFDATHHVSTVKMQPVDGEEVVIGFDTSGIHPAAVIGQVIHGRVQIYFVLYGKEMSFDDFIERVLVPVLNAHFPNSPRIAACDPADARMQESATSPTYKLQNTYHIPAVKAGKSNAFNIRKRAVSEVLNRLNGCVVDGTREDNEYVVNKSFITAITSTYIHKKLKGVFDANGEPVYSNVVHNKDDHSHGIDAFQYLCLYLTVYANFKTKVKRIGTRKKQKVRFI